MHAKGLQLIPFASTHMISVLMVGNIESVFSHGIQKVLSHVH